jgi:rSAM/selenodomain-associated transferase 2
MPESSFHRPTPAMPARRPALSIVIPALNEAGSIGATVHDARMHAEQVLVVDGGSRDETVRRATEAGATVVGAPRGRASQMNVGAARASGRVLLFLHADCRLPTGAAEAIRTAIDEGARWGRFDVRLDSSRLSLAVVGRMMNLRSRLTGIATGDQAIFVERTLWEAIGGYASIPLMEDIELCARLRRVAPCACLPERVTVSARRWETRGVVRTVIEMWAWRAAYALGVSPRRLHRLYYGAPVDTARIDGGS